MSNLSELKPAKSQPFKKLYIFRALSLNIGSFATISSVIPCIRVDSGGIGIPGFNLISSDSLEPSVLTLIIAISIMRSLLTSVPVVSKSKKQSGLVNFNFIYILV